MYKKTNPQKKLFGVDTQLSAGLRARIKTSWAHLFKAEVFPILFKSEDQYAKLYGKTGRPNFSVARVLGLILLQEMNNLSDQEALDAFGFDIRWRYALDTHEEDAYLSRRSLVEFLGIRDEPDYIDKLKMKSKIEGRVNYDFFDRDGPAPGWHDLCRFKDGKQT